MKYWVSFLFISLLFSCTRPTGRNNHLSHKSRLQDGEKFYQLNGIKHWVKIKGSRHQTTPLVIIHGGPGGNNYNFERTIGPKLEAFGTVVYYEQRGCGRSAAPTNPEDYQMKTLLSDLDILRDSLGVQKLNLLGYSFGAELALRYGTQYPNRVKKLIVSAPAELSEANMLVQIQGFYAIGDSVLRAGIEKILKDTTNLERKYSSVWNLTNSAIVDKFLFLNTEAARLNRQLWKESNFKNTGLLAKAYLRETKKDLIPVVTGLQTPTLIISGAYDKNGGLHTGLSLKQVLPNNTLRIYENSAHFPDMEEPGRFAKDVKAFLQTK